MAIPYPLRASVMSQDVASAATTRHAIAKVVRKSVMLRAEINLVIIN